MGMGGDKGIPFGILFVVGLFFKRKNSHGGRIIPSLCFLGSLFDAERGRTGDVSFVPAKSFHRLILSNGTCLTSGVSSLVPAWQKQFDETLSSVGGQGFLFGDEPFRLHDELPVADEEGGALVQIVGDDVHDRPVAV